MTVMVASEVVRTDRCPDVAMLDAVRRSQQLARSAEAAVLVGALEWAVAHPPLDPADRCCVPVPLPGQREELAPLNGEGVPEVSAVAVAELAVVLGLTTEAGRRLVADTLELAYRLPTLWERVRSGDLLAWQGRKVAALTHPLGERAARFVDRHLGAVAGWVGHAQVERLVAEAVARHDLARTVQRIRTEVELRRFDVDLDQTGLDGLVPVSGRLDLPDAIALDAAVAHAAQELSALGSTETLPARRARGLGDLAREHLELWDEEPRSGRVVVDTVAGTMTPVERVLATEEDGEDPAAGGASEASATPTARRTVDGAADARRRGRASRRQIVLHVHLTEATVRGAGGSRAGVGAGLVGRVDNTNMPIDADVIRSWCGEPHTKITVMPVLDVAGEVHHERYEIPNRLREQVIARDTTCVYPGCRAPARRCDLDHIHAYDHEFPALGGRTETSNLAPLCRRHHNLKTTGRISYRMVAAGVFEWRFPTGTRVIRDRWGAATVQPNAGTMSSLRSDVPTAATEGHDPPDP